MLSQEINMENNITAKEMVMTAVYLKLRMGKIYVLPQKLELDLKNDCYIDESGNLTDAGKIAYDEFIACEIGKRITNIIDSSIPDNFITVLKAKQYIDESGKVTAAGEAWYNNDMMVAGGTNKIDDSSITE